MIKNFVMGGTAGIIGASICYPLDMIKTRLQNQRSGGTVLYKNTVDCFIKILQYEGFRGLYKGLPAQLIGIAPEKAVKLTVNDTVRYLLTERETGKIGIFSQMFAGGLAGLTQVVITNPYELIKVRIQTSGSNVKPRIISIIKELGIKGLTTGASATLLRDIPFSAMYFTFYGELREFLRNDKSKPLPMSKTFIAGILAGTLSAALATPADVIKTRLQAKSEVKYNGIADCFYKIVKQEGALALFKGTVARILIISPLFGITLAVYEVLKDHFH